MSESIGIIGLGLLGSAIAERLNEAGRTLHGFDPGQTKTGAARHCPDAGEVVAICSRVIFSLPTSQVVAEVVEEVIDKLHPGQVIIDTTTGAPDEISAVAARLKSRGVHYLEANVAGSSVLLRQGRAALFLGGDEGVADDLAPLFADIASQVHFLGPAGTASRFKLVHNLILGLNRAALGEGLQFAESLGIDGGTALSVLRQTAAGSRAMDAKGERMVNRDYEMPEARLAQHLKDVLLMLDEAERSGAKVPLTRLHHELLREVDQLGFGDADNSAIMESFNRQ